MSAEVPFGRVRVGLTAHADPVSAQEPGVRGFLALVEGFRPCSGAQLVDLSWSAGAPVTADRAEATVTRRRVDGSGTGTVHQDVRLLDAAGKAGQRAQAVWRVAGTGESEAETRVATDFGSRDWARRVGAVLDADQEFAAATATFDGSIGLTIGTDDVDFRIYKGSVIEVGAKSLQGATFTITADELTWVRLFTGPHDDYVRLAARGAFRIKGSGFQYLRMTKAVRILVSRVRSLVADADHA